VIAPGIGAHRVSAGADLRGGEYSRKVPGVAGCGIGPTRSVRSL